MSAGNRTLLGEKKYGTNARVGGDMMYGDQSTRAGGGQVSAIEKKGSPITPHRRSLDEILVVTKGEGGKKWLRSNNSQEGKNLM